MFFLFGFVSLPVRLVVLRKKVGIMILKDEVVATSGGNGHWK